MKKVALILSIVALCSFSIGDVFNDSTMVWICSSSNVYHRLPSCSELKKCAKPTRISLTAAKEKGMTPCSICVDKKEKEKQNPKATESVNKSKSTKVDKTAKNSNTGKGKQSTKAKKAKPEKKATKQTKVDKTTDMDGETGATVEDQDQPNSNEDQDE